MGHPQGAAFYREMGGRLREIREGLAGDKGASEFARRLGIPEKTWLNYEAGCAIPAEILLQFVELTGVEPGWLQHGRGPKFRRATRSSWLRTFLLH